MAINATFIGWRLKSDVVKISTLNDPLFIHRQIDVGSTDDGTPMMLNYYSVLEYFCESRTFTIDHFLNGSNPLDFLTINGIDCQLLVDRIGCAYQLAEKYALSPPKLWTINCPTLYISS